MTREIPLTKGYVALVDDEDYEELSQFKWQARVVPTNVYARRTIRLADGKRRELGMHQQLMSAPEGYQVDHKNHNGVDNRRENLRICTKVQNNQNRRRTKAGGYRGVFIRAEIVVRGKHIKLGSFTSAEDAARAYDAAARLHHGEFAVVNFPSE